MSWVWFGLVGGLIAPFLFGWTSIKIAYEERGIGIAIAYWAGMLVLTVPLMLAMMWVVQKFVR